MKWEQQMDGNGRIRAIPALAALCLAALVALGGCSSSESGTSADSVAAPNAAAPDRAEAADGAAAKAGAADGAAAKAGTGREAAGGDAADPDVAEVGNVQLDQRSIIYTGSIRVRVDDVDQATGEAVRLATAAGGFVGGDRRTGNSDTRRAELELRIPAAKFTTVADQLAALGTQLHREVRTEDVTEQIVDLDARIATQRARVDSGRRLLAQAKSLSDLVMLEGELAKREADLASLEAKKRRLADLAALSTITVTLQKTEPTRQQDEESSVGFLAGLHGGWTALLASLRVLLTVLGALLPWLVTLGVPVTLVVWLLRRRRSTRPVPGGAVPPNGPAPGGGAPLGGPATGWPAPAARSAPEA